MTLNDPALFSLVVPTFEGTRFLTRTLDYFRHVAFDGQIVLSDNSTAGHRRFVAQCPRQYPDLDLEVQQYPENVRFLDKMVATLDSIGSRFVMLHAQDDFMVPAAVERCVRFLADNAEYSVARGRVAMVALSRDGAHAGASRVSLVPHPMRAYEEDNVAERVLSHIRHYAATFYSVHRRETLVESFRRTEAATKNVIFFQYLSSCISVLRGKVRCSDELFYVRQGHEDSWSGRLRKSGDYEHWPMLMTAPGFSRYYHEFRRALAALVEQTCGVPESEFATAVDQAAIGLFRRSFCGQEYDNAEEVHFLQRLEDRASEESRLLHAVVKFAVGYGDTV